MYKLRMKKLAHGQKQPKNETKQKEVNPNQV
jgi:hypothetical protein